MFLFKCVLLMTFIQHNSKSAILGFSPIKTHPKYKETLNNTDFQQADIKVIIFKEEEFNKASVRPSRNIFGYTKYTILIFQKNELIFQKTFRLNSFFLSENNQMIFDQKKHDNNENKVLNFVFELITQKDLYNKNIEEPVSDAILYNEHGKLKLFPLNFHLYRYDLKLTNKLNILPKILNHHNMMLVKNERIYNEGIFSYIIVQDVIIKLPNKNYAQNLYKTFLKIEIIYLINQNIFNEDSSLFFIEFDKLSEKSIEELLEIKRNLEQKMGKTCKH